jgi:predicted site-specific integrase-resolvase
MSKFVSISVAAKALGVSTSTLRRWEAGGRPTPIRTGGGQRRYDLAALRAGRAHVAQVPHKTIAYARVSSRDQRADLEQQKQALALYCASQGWTCNVIADLDSGMNYHKKGCGACSTRF